MGDHMQNNHVIYNASFLPQTRPKSSQCNYGYILASLISLEQKVSRSRFTAHSTGGLW